MKQNQALSDKAYEVKQENNKLKEDNRELRGSKSLLEDIQEVITEKEVNSLNERLGELRKSRDVSRRRDKPKQSKGRSI